MNDCKTIIKNVLFDSAAKYLKMVSVLLAVLCLTGTLFPVYTATYTVNKNGTGDFITIKAALSAGLLPGDTVLISDGDYTSEGRLQLPSNVNGEPGKLVTIKSEHRRKATTAGFSTKSNGTSTLGNAYIRFEGFNITNSTSGWDGGGIVIWGNGIEVVDNYFYDIPSPAVRSSTYVHTDSITVTGNYIFKCNKGIIIVGSNWLVANNEIERLVYSTEDADYMRAFGKNHTIRNNYCHGTLESEIGTSHTDGLQTFSSNGGLHDSVIDGNIFQNYHQGFLSRPDADAASNLIFKNNIYDNRGWSNISNRNGQGVVTGGGENIVFVNNLFIGNNQSVRFFQDGNENGTTGVIKNNIFIETTVPIVLQDNYSVVLGNNVFNNFRTLYSYVTNSTDMVNIDPQLVDLTNLLGSDGIPFTSDDGFRLKRTSPVEDRGENLTGVVETDIFGNKRLKTWDVGPHEIGDKTGLSGPLNLIIVK